MPDLYSRPYEPNPEKCCDACAFGGLEKGGRYEHAEWCWLCPRCGKRRSPGAHQCGLTSSMFPNGYVKHDHTPQCHYLNQHPLAECGLMGRGGR